MVRILVAIAAATVLAAPSTSSTSVNAPVITASARRATETAVFAGGCFWGVEAVFEHVKGVTNVISGYAGGTTANPDYEQVSTGSTGHAESVKVTFDPAVVSYSKLLEVFFSVAHDPTQLNRQGPDAGTQYRSAIFTANAEQEKAAAAFIAQLTKAHKYPKAIVTQLAPLKMFYTAEAYHQDYLRGHLTQPYIVYNDLPKLDELKQQFPSLWVEPTAKK